MLAVYSALTRRVFSHHHRAKPCGALDLLLCVICHYFDKAKNAEKGHNGEGGEDLSEAVDEGSDAVRELLLTREWESL